jgi:hypothetical protein
MLGSGTKLSAPGVLKCEIETDDAEHLVVVVELKASWLDDPIRDGNVPSPSGHV